MVDKSILTTLMLVLEAKLKGRAEQFSAIDDAIRTAQFIRNKALRYWMDNRDTSKANLSKLSAVLAKEFDFAAKLNSMARQASTERAWFAILRFYANCKAKVPGKKGYPRFKKNTRSVEYKTSGWSLSPDKRYLTLTDGFNIGKLKLIGTRELSFYAKSQVKRVRIVKRADGYHAQFCIAVERELTFEMTGKAIGLDVGLTHFYTDSDGNTVENPRLLRKSEKALKRLARSVSKKKKGSNNRKKAINRLGRKHLQVSRQRKDFAVKLARCVIQSNDVVVIEDLQVRNMVRNHKLAKSISDASWSLFRQWLEYFAKLSGKEVQAIAPHWTSQKCSNCDEIVVKSLSTRTHKCSCGVVLDRDFNAALNILNIVGHTRINACGQNDRWNLDSYQSAS